jgi:hypothetical protein
LQLPETVTPPATPTAAGTETVTPDAVYDEGGIHYERINGQIFKNGTLVDPKDYQWIPSQVGGSRVDPEPTVKTGENVLPEQQKAAYTLTDAEKGQFSQMNQAALQQLAANNSAAWHTASESEKLRLQAINQYINGELLGQTFDSKTGTWSGGEQGGGELVVGENAGGQVVTGGNTGGQMPSDILGGDTKYTNSLDTMVARIMERFNTEFSYDPETDVALKAAQKDMARVIMEEMNSRGILNSTITQDTIAKNYASMSAEYYRIAKDDYANETARLMDFAGFLGNLDANEFDKAVTLWQADMEERKFQYDMTMDALTLQIKAEETDYNRARDGIEDAWKRVNELGYVDNEAAITLNVEPGTLSSSVQKAYMERTWELEDKYTSRQQQLTDELRNIQQEKDLYDYKLTREAAVVKENEKEVTTTPAEDAKFIEIMQNFEGKIERGEKSAMEILNHVDALGERFYVSMMGKPNYDEMIAYLKDVGLNPEEEKSDPPITGVKPGSVEYNNQYASAINAAMLDPISPLNYFQQQKSGLEWNFGTPGFVDMLEQFGFELKNNKVVDKSN